MKFFKEPSPNRLEKYHQRRRWARRLNYIFYGLVFTGLLGVAGAGVFIYLHFLARTCRISPPSRSSGLR